MILKNPKTIKQLHDSWELQGYKKDSIHDFIKSWKLKAHKMWSINRSIYFIDEDEIKSFNKRNIRHEAQKLWVRNIKKKTK